MILRRIADVAKVPGNSMAGFWGDDNAWTAAWAEVLKWGGDFVHKDLNPPYY